MWVIEREGMRECHEAGGRVSGKGIREEGWTTGKREREEAGRRKRKARHRQGSRWLCCRYEVSEASKGGGRQVRKGLERDEIGTRFSG